MKQYIYLLFALFSICFYSCSNEETALDGASGRITVSFTLPEDGASTRGGVATLATEDEKLMNGVNLYCFDYENNTKSKLVKAIALTGEQLQQKSLTIELPKGSYYFEAIANEGGLRLNTGADVNYADFQALRANTEKYDQWCKDGFLMQGGAAAQITNITTGLNIPFTMIRLVARIDVVNTVQGLTITKATIENSVKESFYLEDANSAIAKEGEGKKETRIAAGLTIGMSERSTRLFYTYEGAVEESGLQISFEGTDADGILHKSLPIVNFTNGNNEPAIKRNKLYVVTLTEVDGAVKAEVTVKDWSQKSIDTDVTVEKELKVDFPAELPEGVTVSETSASSGDKATITIPDVGGNVVFQIASSIEAEAVETPDAEWLSINEISMRALVQSFTLEVKKNTAHTRTATFIVRNKLTHKVAVTYTVTQNAAKPTGPDWSKLPVITEYGAATLEQWVDSEDAMDDKTGKSFFMYAVNSAVDVNSPIASFNTRGGYWQSSNDPSAKGYYMATKTDWMALAKVSNLGSGKYLTYNNTHYYISTNNRGSNKVKIVFQQCEEDGTKSGDIKTIEFGGEGSIRTKYKSTLPWNCTSVASDNISRYWCAGGAAYYVDISNSVALTSVNSTLGASKGIDWYAMRVRSLKKKND